MLEDEEEGTIGQDFSDNVGIDGEDNVETRNYNSDTEEDDETQPEDKSDVSSNEGYFISKDLPRVIGTARNAKNPVECWNCLFTNDLLQCVVKYTNQEDEEEGTIGEDFSDDVGIDGEDNVETRNHNSETEEDDETQP
ncbi:hypothetical protein QE152_g37943 [Popillia japonica]|uniref:Uncharacterized protein n=1 Tax=Popillia japonica TaxID=7064 RepID=A0AAW1I9E6_POPJA